MTRAARNVLSVVLVAAAASRGRAAAPAGAPFQFHGDSPLTLAWKGGSCAAAATTVVNNTTSALALRVALPPLGLEQDGTPVDNATALVLTADDEPVRLDGSGAFRLPASGSVTLRLVAPSAVPGSRPASGPRFLTLSDSYDTRSAVRIPVQLVPEALASPPSAKPLVDNLTLTILRTPFFDWKWCIDCGVPLSTGSGAPSEGTVGAVSNELGGTTLIQSAGTRESMLLLDTPSAPGPGSYKGTIDLLPADPKGGEVKVTLQVKHDPTLPLVVLIASVWLGLVAKRFLASERAVITLRAQEAGLQTLFASCQAAFAQASRGRPFAGSTIDEALATARTAVVEELDALEASGQRLGPDGLRHQQIEKGLAEIANALRAWARLPVELADLAAVRDDVAAAAQKLASLLTESMRGQVPEVLTGLAAVLRPRVLPALVAIGGWVGEAETWRRRAARWAAAAAEIDRLYVLCRDHPPDADLEKKFGAGVRALWSYGGQEEEEPTITQAIHEIAEQIDALAESRRSASDAPAEGGERVVFTMAVDAAERGADRPTPPRDQAFYLRLLGRWDRGVAILAFLVAVATGFRDLYLDKPFGTWKDYVSLALVGVTTRLAIDLVGAAIDRLAVRRTA
jgi:hypothetical protein